MHPSGVAKSSTSLGGKVTSAGWQVTLCDLIWHVISRSGVVISITNCYIRFTLRFTLLPSSQSGDCIPLFHEVYKMPPPELLFLAQICTKSFFGWNFAPNPGGGAYSTPPEFRPLTDSRVKTPREGEETGREGQREGKVRGGKKREMGRKGGKGRGKGVPRFVFLQINHWLYMYSWADLELPQLPLLPSRKASPPFGWCSLHLPTKGWPG